MKRLIVAVLALFALVSAYASQPKPIFVNSTQSEAGWQTFKRDWLDQPNGSSYYKDEKFPALVLGNVACRAEGLNKKVIPQDRLSECVKAFMSENGIETDAELTKEAFMARGQGARYYVPKMLLAQAPTASSGAATSGTGAMPAPAAAPAASRDMALDRLTEQLRRDVEAISTGRASDRADLQKLQESVRQQLERAAEKANATASGNTAAAAAAQAAATRGANAAEKSAGAATRAEAAVKEARSDLNNAKALAADAQASAAGADARSIRAADSAASAVDLARLSYNKSLEVEKGLRELKVFDWKPYVAVVTLLLLFAASLDLLRRRTKKDVANVADATAALSSNLETLSTASTNFGTRLGSMEQELKAVVKFQRGTPGYTEICDEKTFSARVSGLSPVTNPTMACPVTVVDAEGEERLLNINITTKVIGEYTLEGVKDQGSNPLKFDTLLKRIKRAGLQGRIVGCKPFVPGVGSPANGPATQPLSLGHRAGSSGKHHGIAISDLAPLPVPASLLQPVVGDTTSASAGTAVTSDATAPAQNS